MKKNPISSPHLPDDNKERQEKIAAIKRAIEDGTYKVDNRRFADSLLLDLLWEQMERLRLLTLDVLNDLNDNHKIWLSLKEIIEI